MIYEAFKNLDFMHGLILFVVQISALFLALPVHEWAHAYVAYKQGDATAKYSGRMTLAPHAHFDLWGFLFLYFFGFGWAKPVPVNSTNFKNPKKSGILVSLAGITANLIVGTILIIISSALARFCPNYVAEWGYYGYALKNFLASAISINFVLVFFNILPIYPLDGFRVIESLSSKPKNSFLEFMRRYSWAILLLLILFTYIFDLYFTYTAGMTIEGISYVFDKLFSLI